MASNQEPPSLKMALLSSLAVISTTKEGQKAGELLDRALTAYEKLPEEKRKNVNDALGKALANIVLRRKARRSLTYFGLTPQDAKHAENVLRGAAIVVRAAVADTKKPSR
jgi:hypothetical protein